MDGNTSINLCRICLENGANLPIFEVSEVKNCDIHSKLCLFLKEKIEDIEGYPRYICQTCNNLLDDACKLIHKYKETCRILKNGLNIIIKENPNLSSFSCDDESEPEIFIDDVKKEIKSDDDVFKHEIEECFEPLEIEVKKENPSKALTRKRTTKTNTKQITNKLASSILEGAFEWNGDKWCVNSGNQKLTQEKPKVENKKRIRIKIAKAKLPKPPKLCDLCGEVFTNQDKLSVHKRKVHYRNPVRCAYCSRLFESEYCLKRHTIRKHEGEKKFVCTVCGRGFAFQGELRSHNKNVHNKHLKPKKQFKCKFCNKIYKCAKSVIVHERSAHTGQRPAVCTVCDSSFYHVDYLKEHMRLHTGETPFKCPICGRGYAQRCNMKSHLRIHKKSELDAATLSKLRPNYLRLLKA